MPINIKAVEYERSRFVFFIFALLQLLHLYILIATTNDVKHVAYVEFFVAFFGIICSKYVLVTVYKLFLVLRFVQLCTLTVLHSLSSLLSTLSLRYPPLLFFTSFSLNLYTFTHPSAWRISVYFICEIIGTETKQTAIFFANNTFYDNPSETCQTMPQLRKKSTWLIVIGLLQIVRKFVCVTDIALSVTEKF